MQDLTNLDDAREEAALLLGMSSDRWDHVAGVAAAARAVVDVVPPEDADLLVAAAWLHDIGYSPAIAHTGFHPLDGARHLRLGAPPRLCSLVAHHPPRRRGEGAAHARDAARGVPAGGVDRRRRPDVRGHDHQPHRATGDRGGAAGEILERYPPTDPVHRAISESSEQLRAAVARVEARLGVRQPR